MPGFQGKDVESNENFLTQEQEKGHRFYGRGGIAAVFSLASLTTDGAYHDLDLSLIIPNGTVAVLLRVALIDDAAGSYILFRKEGDANVDRVMVVRSQVANVWNEGDGIMPIGESKKLQYATSNLTFSDMLIVVKGWWK